jgi:nitrile hydratase accessory protein
MSAPEPVFAAPWHAEAFALAVSLEAAGLFVWSEWTEVFGAVLAEQGAARDLDGGDDYFFAWVTALERICTSQGLAEVGVLASLQADWEAAYLSTPHGAPVRIG